MLTSERLRTVVGLVLMAAAPCSTQQPRQQSVPSTPQPRRLPPSSHKVSATFVRHIDAYFHGRDVASYNPFAPMECDGVIHLTDSGTPGRLLHRRGPSPWTQPGTWVVTEKAYHVDDYLHYFDKVTARRVCSAPVCQTFEKFALL